MTVFRIYWVKWSLLLTLSLPVSFYLSVCGYSKFYAAWVAHTVSVRSAVLSHTALRVILLRGASVFKTPAGFAPVSKNPHAAFKSPSSPVHAFLTHHPSVSPCSIPLKSHRLLCCSSKQAKRIYGSRPLSLVSLACDSPLPQGFICARFPSFLQFLLSHHCVRDAWPACISTS